MNEIIQKMNRLTIDSREVARNGGEKTCGFVERFEHF